MLPFANIKYVCTTRIKSAPARRRGPPVEVAETHVGNLANKALYKLGASLHIRLQAEKVHINCMVGPERVPKNVISMLIFTQKCRYVCCKKM